VKLTINWVKAHPRLAAWIVLALGMNLIVGFEARSVGLLAGQWLALLVATTLVAGLCVWIIGWEDDDDEEPGTLETPAPSGPPTAARPEKSAP
jgi:hypothetical protein